MGLKRQIKLEYRVWDKDKNNSIGDTMIMDVESKTGMILLTNMFLKEIHEVIKKLEENGQ